MSTRRAFVAGLTGALSIPAAALPTPAKADVASVKRAVDDLTAAMAELHGAQWPQWEAHVDHDTGFILIQPKRKGGGQ
ncbi:hypothetical protein [Reyranella soli]|jgi:hypothetical protein|uniref:PepSY domain-containing protein n=1 Tax=Reyranella soli TaxID=1230389 RepID=A0A512NSJ5_9HYPH|nr:hypothetical protein [Reyranella soli]GEP61928.1 hypothetical protein RSO01_90940 [Reyranella soli]